MIAFRSIFRELISPFVSTCIVMSALLMLERVYRLVNLVVSNRLRMQELGEMLLYLVPQILTITLPLAVVGAVFITVIRHSLDSELICHRATGRSLWNYSQAYVAFGLMAMLITAAFTLWVQPISYARYVNLELEMIRYRADERI
ncbi:MAG TPA: LptF/LptG family permease, partial [bacterium]|nr:LptF/LptG family permease [bacterium]